MSPSLARLFAAVAIDPYPSLCSILPIQSVTKSITIIRRRTSTPRSIRQTLAFQVQEGYRLRPSVPRRHGPSHASALVVLLTMILDVRVEPVRRERSIDNLEWVTTAWSVTKFQHRPRFLKTIVGFDDSTLFLPFTVFRFHFYRILHCRKIDAGSCVPMTWRSLPSEVVV